VNDALPSPAIAQPSLVAGWEAIDAAWRARVSGQFPRWTDYLDRDCSTDSSDGILNLLQIDIEFRIKSGLSALFAERYFDHPGVTLSDEQKIELIFWEFQQRWKNGDRADPREYRAAFPVLAERLSDLKPRCCCPKCRRQIAVETAFRGTIGCPFCRFEINLDAVFPARITASPSRAEGEPFALAGYELLGELGHGGMGIVYKARQVGLNRLVAIKMIRDAAHATSAERTRFLAEAEAVAQLQHPNIIHIYEVLRLQPADAREATPCLVMEFVEGSSLDRRLAGAAQPPRAAAELVETLARAIHYAHERGIVHRDLKPANILLQYGSATPNPARTAETADTKIAGAGPSVTAFHGSATPKITDFGLAKRLDSGQKQTKTGEILGTPGYMAPEQARGIPGSIGPWTDVYALGAILYELLAGRPPFQSDSAWETIAQVLANDPVPPSRAHPVVPRDLETICMKCLAKEPDRRYATALELADDLARFRADAPIHARPIGRAERIWRWCRREPKVAFLVIAVFGALLLGGAGAAGLWWHNQRQADARFEADLRDLDGEVSFISGEELSLVPQMDESRRQRLEQLAAKCQSLLDQRSNRPALRRKNAEVRHYLGTIDELLGRHVDAEAAYREAIAIRMEVAAAADRAPRDERDLGRTYFQLANLLVATGRFEEAESLYSQAFRLQSRADQADDVDLRPDRGETLQRLGTLQVRTGRFVEAEDNLQKALRLQQSLVAEQKDRPGWQFALAQTESALAGLWINLSRFPESEPLLDAAVDRQDKLTSASNAAPAYRLGLARTLTARGRFREVTGRSKESESDLHRAFEVLKRLADDYPHRPDYRVESAAALHGVAREVMGYDMEARYRAAVAAQEQLTREVPALVENRERLATTLNSLATWLNDKSTYQKHWLFAIPNLAEAYTVHKQSEAIWVQLVADYPMVLSFKDGLARSDQRFGIVLERLKRLTEAERHYRHSIAIQEEFASKYPQVAKHRLFLCALYNNLAVTYDRQKELTAAESLFRRAHEFGREAHTINPLNPVASLLMSDVTRNLAMMALKQGHRSEANARIDEYIRWRPDAGWDDGKVFWLFQFGIESARNDATLSAAERAKWIADYEDGTIAHLKVLLARPGPEHRDYLTRMQREPQFDHVRRLDSFQKLLRDLAADLAKP
jgi:serine/threonine protein kinase/tetratricopeptide (TPR) repeat protein